VEIGNIGEGSEGWLKAMMKMMKDAVLNYAEKEVVVSGIKYSI
jgi:hypothetical protein